MFLLQGDLAGLNPSCALMAVPRSGSSAEMCRRPQFAAASRAAFFFLDFFDALAPLAPEAASAVAVVVVAVLELAAALALAFLPFLPLV